MRAGSIPTTGFHIKSVQTHTAAKRFIRDEISSFSSTSSVQQPLKIGIITYILGVRWSQPNPKSSSAPPLPKSCILPAELCGGAFCQPLQPLHGRKHVAFLLLFLFFKQMSIVCFERNLEVEHFLVGRSWSHLSRNQIPCEPGGMIEVRERSGGGVCSLELSQDEEMAAYGLSVCIKFQKEK